MEIHHAIVIEHPQQKRGVCFHVDKPCFTLKAPVNKTHKSYEKLRLNYYINRMKSSVEIAKSPDMNMTLNEIKTGITATERAKSALFVYLVGVIFIFLLNSDMFF